jgi:Zn-dependent protease
MSAISMIFFVAVIIFSAIIHEYAHAWMADQLGDPTARYAGRLTLNPKAHIDLFGSIILPLLLIPTGFLFAYAKPVPYNPYNLKDQKIGPVWVGIAGPLSNFILAFVFGLVLQFLRLPELTSEFVSVIVYANILLGVFNMIPIPPLDGSKLLYAFVPSNKQHFIIQLERYGMWILLVFLFLGGSSFLHPVISFLFNLFTGIRMQ